VRNLFRTVGCKFIEPIDHLGITAALIDEARQPVTAVAPAFLAGDSYQIELADQIREDDCAIARHVAISTGPPKAYTIGTGSEATVDNSHCRGCLRVFGL
jgi:hypothetical protein